MQRWETRRRGARWAWSGALGALLLFSAGSAAGEARIVNGVNTHDFPTTGAMLCASSRLTEDNAQSCCSGTLIGCRTFLTAAHCVDGDLNASHYAVFLQHAGIIPVSRVSQHPSYVDRNFPRFDVAILELAEPVTGIDPTPINTAANPADVGFGLDGTIAGFGRTGGTSENYGIKRAGRVQTSSCGSAQDNEDLVCWTFSTPVGDPGEDSNTCNGDSGGPLFLDLGAGSSVAGVTSGGTSGTCLATDGSYDANVYTFRSYVLGELGSDSTSACSDLSPVGDPRTHVRGFDGNLSAGNPGDDLSFEVATGTDELRVALNGEDNGLFNADLYVRHGTGASSSLYDCKADGASVFGACTFISPAAGTWSVYVARRSGAGEYQVTATTFSADPPVCGDGVAQSGEQCDGTDDDACSGLCQSDCTCPAPVCGNDVVESGEQCDGTQTSACPTGECRSDCTCPAPVCGNDVVEAGEQCDGTDDASCSGLCQNDCTCPAICTQDEMFVLRARVNERAFRMRAILDNFFGTFDGMDPRNGFTLVVSEGGNEMVVDIAPDDPRWWARPERGRYVWRHRTRTGIRAIRLVERPRRGWWVLAIVGRRVEGAGDIDEWMPLDVRLHVDQVCTETVY